MKTGWEIRNHGKAVNLYQIKQMLGYESIQQVEENLKEEYPKDIQNFRDRYNKDMTFAEYVNAKRHWLACIMGMQEYR